MKIEVNGYTVEIERGTTVVKTGEGKTYSPTTVQDYPFDPPAIAHIRKLFYGKPDTPETAFAIAKALMEPQYRDYYIRTDWGIECEVSDDGKTWTRRKVYGYCPDLRFPYLTNTLSFTYCRVPINQSVQIS